MLANALINNGAFSAAQQLLQRAIELKPDMPEPYMRLGAIAINNRDYPEAIELLHKAMELKPGEPSVYANIIIALRYTDRHEEALKYLREAFNKLNDAEIAAHLGEVLWVSGDEDAAQRIWQDALRQTPEHKTLLDVIERFTE